MSKSKSRSRDLYQYRLPSGRGVRLVELLPSERDESERNAARELGKDATLGDLTLSAMRAGVTRMIKFITEQTSFKTPEELMAPSVKWKEVGLADLDENYDEYFTSKDDNVLCHLYRRLHVVTSDDIESIVGKEQMVSTG